MNKTDCCNVDLARRSFILSAGAGLGALSLLDVLGAGALAQAPASASVERRHARRRADSGAREARHHAAHAGRHLARRHVRLQADARENARPGHSAVSARNAALVDDVERPIRFSDRRTVAPVSAAWRERRLGERFLAVHRGDRRRALLREERAHRAREPRSGVEVSAYGIPARGPPVGRRLGQLCARHRQPRPAELRRHELGRLARRAAGRGDLGPGVPAVAPSGRRVPRRR